MDDPRLLSRSAWGRFIAGFGYAFSGLWYALRTQRNARVHLAAAVLAIAASLLLRLSALELALVAVAIGSVWVAELFNTVIEISLDLVHPDYHPLAKRAKDVSAAAVLVSALLAVTIALCVFGPHLWALLRR